ncbi:hypothetical protein DPX16_3114 [Anabarilius grahami]|uniref:Uncharacterized protein n=1 Tax=Anabarilius grahami TaxID=495550 RepID=A0A3N0XPW5_ANAGA|nr:hypothetical protein DPX16_3114 [Anabarilius grahami]
MEFLFLAPLTTFPDDTLCSFLIAGLNTSTRALLSGKGPRGSFATFVEWVLASCGSPLTVGPVNDDASPTHNPVHNQNHPDGEDLQLEPTAGHVSNSTATFEPAPVGATEPNNAMEPEQHESEQVCELATTSIVEGVLVDIEAMEVSPAHPPATESELLDATLDLCHFGEIEPFALLSSESVNHVPSSLSPPILPLPSHPPSPLPSSLSHHLSKMTVRHPLQSPTSSATLSSLSPISPSVPPLPPLSGAVTPLDCWESSPPGLWEPVAPPPASACSTPLRLDIPPWLHHSTMAPPSSDAALVVHWVTIQPVPVQGHPLDHTTCTTLDSYAPPPPGWPSTSRTTTCILLHDPICRLLPSCHLPFSPALHHILVSQHPPSLCGCFCFCYGARSRLLGGGVMSQTLLFVLLCHMVFFVLFFPPSSVTMDTI